MLHGDVAHLSAIFGDGLEHTHSSGVRQDAAEYLHGLATGADVYREIEHGIDRVVQLPDSVLVYGWQRMTVESGGTLRKLDNLSLAVLSRKDGGWKLFAYVSTPRAHPDAEH
jgi:hypothetical protein